MKKVICAILFLVVMCTVITSCAPSTAETRTIQNQLVGTWVEDTGTISYWYVFTPDWGFCQITSLPNGGASHETMRGTYEIGAKNIKLKCDDGNTYKRPYHYNKSTRILMSVSGLKKVSSDYDLY